jgi:hypothetical protein
MNSIEKYDNLIELFKQALKFYGEKDNYVPKTKNTLGDRYISMVELDEGSQARFAIEQANQLAELNQKIEEDYNKSINELLDTDIDDMDIRDIIKTFKQIEE